jgi:hypothetical protein
VTGDPEAHIRQALEDLLADCAVEDSAAIPYRQVIPVIARQLTVMQRADASPERTKRAKKELMNVSKTAADLVAAISRLSDDAMGALDLPARFQAIRLSEELPNIAAASKKGADKLPGGSKGAPVRRSSAGRIVEFLYQEYERLIGEPPTRIVSSDGVAGGPFLRLVKAVFTALSVTASPENAARKVMERKKK